MGDEKVWFNGLDGSTGEYLVVPLTPEELSARIPRLPEPQPDEPEDETGLEDDPFRKPIVDIERPWDLSEAGWGVIFAPEIDPGVRPALEELLEHRRRNVGTENSRYFRDNLDYRTGDSVKTFLERHRTRPGQVADAKRLPYYLLLVGDPQSIPYEFQFELDIHYGVGRIFFDTAADYRRYAESVVAAEDGGVRLPRRLTLFGTRNEGDPATRLTADELIEPLSDDILEEISGWGAETVLGEKARRDLLRRLLGGEETPGLLFAACHGVAFPHGDPRQEKRQGALVCQDGPGRKDEVGVRREHYFAAEDLPEEVSLRGLIAFLYACHSAGTPERNSLPEENELVPQRIADKELVSALPQALLTRGALAVIGHVDRALTSSFAGSPDGEGIDPYRNCLRRLLNGHTVGWAMEFFNQEHATLGAQLARHLENNARRMGALTAPELPSLWRLKNDMRSFAVFGDPAVRVLGGRG
ncbi:MAG TPA: hypothetical protein VE685_01745 [Thermoanaerobaculia bacterium]|nr:hypothetical protein [Thermoanaerobaculia bacterium]